MTSIGLAKAMSFLAMPKEPLLERMGIAFRDGKYTIPDGWKIKVSRVSWMSYILDERGRKRVNIYHDEEDGAPPDLVPVRRYSYNAVPTDLKNKKKCPWVGIVTDQQKEIWRSSQTLPRERYNDLLGLGIAWLDEHFPDWGNPLMYWD